jgi:hypothetical protein
MFVRSKVKKELGITSKSRSGGNMMPLNLEPAAASGTLMATAKKHEIWSAWRGGNHAGSGL